MITSIDTTTRIETSHRLKLAGTELLNMISQERAALGMDRIPDNATIVVGVPGGGDWSNTELDLNEYPVEIRWTVIEES